MEGIKINISNEELTDMVKQHMLEGIKKSVEGSKKDIEITITKYFERNLWDNKVNEFDKALDWAVEGAFREGLETAMTEMKFEEMVANKCKEIMSNSDFLQKVAEEKIKQAIGL